MFADNFLYMLMFGFIFIFMIDQCKSNKRMDAMYT